MRMPGVAVPFAAAVALGALFAGDSAVFALAVVLAVGGWAALALAGRAPLTAGGLVPLGLLLALAAWTGLSVLWSVAPDRSWAELDRTLLYAAFLGAGLLLGARGPGSARLAARLLAGALGAAVLWALAGKAIPALFPDGGRAARLRDPIGYWNALALAADMLLVLALALAAEARRPLERAAWAAAAFLAVPAILLAASRAGVAAALVGLAALLALRRDRVETALLALAAAVPGGLVAAWAFTRPALVEDGRPEADRVADGAVFGLLLLAGVALVALLSRELARRPLGTRLRRRAARGLALLALAAGLALAGGLAANIGSVLDEFRGGEVTNEPGRLGSLSSNNRLAWWGEAWDVFAAEPLTGSGAGTFEVVRKRHRENAAAVTQPHSVPLQLLAGVGLPGFALFAALVAAAALAAVRGVRRAGRAERGAAAALALVPALWLLHALVDYDWDFAAVTGPALLAVGVLAAAGRAQARPASQLAAASAGALALAAAASIATPWLAERAVRDVAPALERGALEAARDAAERARALDPLALDPLLARARVEELAGDERAALAAYRLAAELQPENPVSWYELGLYEFDRGDRCSAYVHLNRAYTLDPAGLQWRPGAELDQARDWVNAGNC